MARERELATLHRSRRMRLIQPLAERLREQLADAEGRLPAGVLDVGAGTKLTDGAFVTGKPPCVKVLVEKKGDGSEHPIDPVVALRLGRHTYRVLTDVEEFEPGRLRLQGRVDVAAEIRSGQVGSLGFVMQDAHEGRYAVSAAHVLQSETAVWTKGGLEGRGRVLTSTRFPSGPSGSGRLDAAVADVDRLGPIRRPPSIPYAEAATSWSGALQLRNVIICGKHGTVPAQVSFRVAELPTTPRLERVLMCLLHDGVRTADGDSGAPILSSNGHQLVGIHLGIYPDPDRYPPPYHSVGHVAGDLLDRFSELTGNRLQLWRPREP